MPKTEANYASKLDQSELIRDGLQARWDRQFGELKRLVSGHEKGAEIMQIFERACSTRAGLASTIELVKRYQRLVAAQATKQEQMTTAPGPTPTPAESRARAHAR